MNNNVSSDWAIENRLTVWIVDDDPIQTFIYQKLSQTLSHSQVLTCFKNGREAIEQFYRSRECLAPDIIILDVNMPFMNGWEFLDVFSAFPAEATKTISIYMSSSSALECDLSRARQYSCVKGYIVKPINQLELNDILRACSIRK